MVVGSCRPGNWWNEHVNCAIALWCDEATFRAVQACAEDRRAHTGTYNLITYNCLTFCDEALAAGGIHLLTESGRELHTIVPKDAFRDVDRVEGAHPFEAWKYWFPLGEPPSNGLRTIQDVPGRDKPLNKRCDLGIYLVQSRLSGRRAPHDARIAESRRRGGVGRWTAAWRKRPWAAAGRGTRAERETGDEKIKSEEGR